MSIQEEIIKTINLMVTKALEDQRDMDIASVVTKVDGTNITVSINGTDYPAINGIGISLKPGDGVYVHKMNGNINRLYVMTKK